ncbi:MAG: hypothetical protein KJ955_04430 [Nanoarchaeota archaeon]|nr:hypothetical protein [Nanoarchaeota archaeon]
MEFNLEKCKDKGAYSAKPVKTVHLDFTGIRKAFKVLEDTPILLLIEEDGFEIIVHKHGELMFKNPGDMEKMRKVAEKVYKAGLQ